MCLDLLLLVRYIVEGRRGHGHLGLRRVARCLVLRQLVVLRLLVMVLLLILLRLLLLLLLLLLRLAVRMGAVRRCLRRVPLGRILHDVRVCRMDRLGLGHARRRVGV